MVAKLGMTSAEVGEWLGFFDIARPVYRLCNRRVAGKRARLDRRLDGLVAARGG
jgi:hypothetical protein